MNKNLKDYTNFKFAMILKLELFCIFTVVVK